MDRDTLSQIILVQLQLPTLDQDAAKVTERTRPPLSRRMFGVLDYLTDALDSTGEIVEVTRPLVPCGKRSGIQIQEGEPVWRVKRRLVQQRSRPTQGRVQVLCVSAQLIALHRRDSCLKQRIQTFILGAAMRC